MLPFDFRCVTETYGLCINIFLVFRHVLEFHKLPNDGCQAPHKDQRKVACHQAKVPGRKLVYDTNFAPLGWRESRVTMKFPHVNDLLFPEEQKVQKTMSVSACYQAFCLTDSKRMFIRITTRVFPRIIGPAASGWHKGADNRKVSPRIIGPTASGWHKGAEWPNLV